MIQKTINLYKFSELSEEVQKKVIEKNSEINVDYEWYESDLYYLIEKIQKKTGLIFKKEDICFELYCNGKNIWIDSKDVYKSLRTKYGYKFNDIELSKNFEISSDIGENLVLFEEIEDEEDELVKIFREKENQKVAKLICVDLIKLAKILEESYRDLIKSYDYLTSYEGIKDSLEANEYEYLENGDRL